MKWLRVDPSSVAELRRVESGTKAREVLQIAQHVCLSSECKIRSNKPAHGGSYELLVSSRKAAAERIPASDAEPVIA